jgi:hypothetical protein
LACHSCDSQHHLFQGIVAQGFDPSLLKVMLIVSKAPPLICGSIDFCGLRKENGGQV